MLNSMGKKELAAAIARQTLVQCDPTASRRLATAATLIRVRPGRVIIKQGAATNDVFFVIQGSLRIIVNKTTQVAIRSAGQHVGEMASLLNSTRTATVVANEESLLAKVSGKAFLKIAGGRTLIWRNLAVELAQRLHQRRNLIREPNPRPVIFIGSSGKHLAVAEALEEGLGGLNAVIKVWSDAFKPSSVTINTLTTEAKRADFAILVFGRDDIVISKGKRSFGPRDNVVFEAGLFMGAISRERTFVVRQKNANVKILSDLEGVTLLDYHQRNSKCLIDVKKACRQIRSAVTAVGIR